MKKLNKKGFYESTFGSFKMIAISAIVITLVLVVTFLIMSEGRTVALSKLATSSANNESVTWSNGSWTALTHTLNVNGLTCLAVANDTNHDVVLTATTNYSCGYNGINVTDYCDGCVASTLYVNYTYQDYNYAVNGTDTMRNATQTLPSFMGIVFITLIGGVLIMLVKRFRY